MSKRIYAVVPLADADTDEAMPFSGVMIAADSIDAAREAGARILNWRVVHLFDFGLYDAGDCVLDKSLGGTRIQFSLVASDSPLVVI